MTLDRPPLLGLIGHARTGKDTFAARLVEDHGYRRVAFADPLRRLAYALDPIAIVRHHYAPLTPARAAEGFPQGPLIGHEVVRLAALVDAVGWEEAKTHDEVRRTLQRLGTEAGREVLGADVWVRLGMAAAEEARRDYRPVVLTDVRFPNEAEAVAAAGGLLLRMVRDVEGVVPHVSETALDDWAEDLAVLNRGTIADLHSCADQVATLVQTGAVAPCPRETP